MFVHRRRASTNSAPVDDFEATQLQLLNQSLQFLLACPQANIERDGRPRPEGGPGPQGIRQLRR